MKKRILSILLLCCMVLTMLPTAAFAAGGAVRPAATQYTYTLHYDANGGSGAPPSQSVTSTEFHVWVRFLYKGIIIKHNKTEPTYTKTSLFLCEKRRFFMARTEKGVVATI